MSFHTSERVVVEFVLFVGVHLVRERDSQRVIVSALLHGRITTEHKAPFLAGTGLVVVGLGIGIDQFEVHAAAIAKCERVIAEVLATFDLVLISIRPVQFDFFATVRDGVRILVDAS